MTADPSFSSELPAPSPVPAEVRYLPGFNPRDMAVKLSMELGVARREVGRMRATGETYDLPSFEAHVRRTIVSPLHAIEMAAGLALTDTTDFDVVMPRNPLDDALIDTSTPELWV
ncbi:MAG TPA: hypothetical protein VG992_02960 [Candidatus Saccharimonadales bacterium]|nr:hypothetical protein [Candidatus Saccharimonadales bacterium]